ncbi:PRC-barrel domain containing protein [Aeromicrobium phragmitis]|uniref:PRC-barrel domain containing protein n=1 Tax=Aeromicrobium phragmitis TaxID=2478914 RepID=UPI001409A9AE|nr:PRC-barrel domain containing protein [Aeromicrobium phragmitis]
MKGDTHRLSDLVGMDVRDDDGASRGVVVDLRAVRVDGSRDRARVQGFVVAPHHTGSMLGYDRGANRGPAILRWAIRRLHRGAVFAPWESVVELDWSANVLRVDASRLERLRSVDS